MNKIDKKLTTFGTANIYLTPSFDETKLDEEIGAKLIDANLLAITDDGTNFEEEKEIYTSSVAGVNGKNVKGFQNIVKAEGKISATGRLVNQLLLEASLYKKETNSSTTHDVYGVEEGVIDDSMYKDVVMVATNKNHENGAIVVLHNAYNTNLSIETKSGDDGTCKLEFVSNYSIENINKVPYKIIQLKPATA